MLGFGYPMPLPVQIDVSINFSIRLSTLTVTGPFSVGDFCLDKGFLCLEAVGGDLRSRDATRVILACKLSLTLNGLR